jgi:hypothetical protein
VVDFGSGCGTVVTYVAQWYQCKCYGIECKPELVDFAKQNNKRRLCVFKCKDFTTFCETWLDSIGATHVFAFDGVFAAGNWNSLFHNVIGLAKCSLVGASVSKFSNHWPQSLHMFGDVIRGIKLVGGKSAFSFAIWKTLPMLSV